MMALKRFLQLGLCIVFSLGAMHVFAQQPAPADTIAQKQINIIHADKISYSKKDTANEYQILVGHVAVQQERTLFYCDSASLNTKANILESFGNVHINDADSLDIYSDYLKYLGREKKATLTGKVKLTDGKGTLTTSRLDYDLQTHISTYTDGAKVVNGNTVLTSKEGVYYEDTRDVYFKRNVVLVNPDYTIKTDTLLYNTYTGIATFIVPTEIVSDSGKRKILTSDGWYDTKNKNSYFGKRPTIQDGTAFLTADEVADDSSGYGEARGNVVYRDTAQKVTLFSNHMNTNRNEGTFLATEKPVMIMQQDDDSIFIAADTMFSGRISKLVKTRVIPDIMNLGLKQDDSNANQLSLEDSSSADDSTGDAQDSSLPADTTLKKAVNRDSTAIVIADSSGKKPLVLTNLSDSLEVNKPAENDSTDRFFEAYYHVRIFSDSLQAVGDSLFYSGKDSAFRLFKDPVVWSRQSQITGDTIYLYTQNKKPSRMYVFENAMAVEKVGSIYYNQIKGRTINGTFVNGELDNIRAKGNGESVYYAQDDDNKFVGVNTATADVIDMYVQDRKPNKVVFRNNLVGTMHPMRQVNHEQIRLRGFQWLDERRPKTQYDLFAD